MSECLLAEQDLFGFIKAKILLAERGSWCSSSEAITALLSDCQCRFHYIL